MSCVEGQHVTGKEVSHAKAPVQHTAIREAMAVEMELGEKSLEACASRSHKLLFELGVSTKWQPQSTDVSRQLMGAIVIG